MKFQKRTEYGTRKTYCRCNCCGYRKEDFVAPFTEYFENVSQRCPTCRSRYFFFTIHSRMKYNIERNLK